MKITVSRLLETSRFLATKVGQEIPDFFTYMSEFVENVVRALSGGLTLADNFACTIRSVQLRHNVAETITSDRTAVAIIPVRVVSTLYGIDSIAWYYDEQGRLTVRVGMTGPPSTAQEVVLAILH